MKKLIFTLSVISLSLSPLVYADPQSPDESYDYINVGQNIAGVYWSSKYCTAVAQVIGEDSSCPVPPNPDLFVPTVVIFNGENGSIVKHIRFFDDTCPYVPVSLQGDKNHVTLIAAVPPLMSGIGNQMGDSYPDCPHLSDKVKIVSETRKIRDGELERKVELQEINSYSFD